MTKSENIIKLIELHIIGLNSIIEAKKLYEEYISNSDLNFQNNLFTSSYINKISEIILPNSLKFKLANEGPENHEEQINWIIRQLEMIKVKAEKNKNKRFQL